MSAPAFRYAAFKLPVSGQWGVINRRTMKFIRGVTCEDEAAAKALAKLLNYEAHREQWTVAEPAPVTWRLRDSHPTTFAISPRPPEAPAATAKRFSFAEYVRQAPESERRLIARLRMPAAAD